MSVLIHRLLVAVQGIAQQQTLGQTAPCMGRAVLLTLKPVEGEEPPVAERVAIDEASLTRNDVAIRA